MDVRTQIVHSKMSFWVCDDVKLIGFLLDILNENVVMKNYLIYNHILTLMHYLLSIYKP